ncbi:MAG: hypothetical protein Q4P32_02515, partial [Micrococcales bacterium]|nr:hypothetical protein [Micrococcales bacterium]
TVTAQGRSRAHVGGRAAPVRVLAEVGERLVAVHGQADQWRLRRPEEHRSMLDDFGGPPLAAARAAYAQQYEACVRLSTQLTRTRDLERDREIESEVLRRGLNELEHLNPQPGEEDALAAEDERLSHADGLRVAADRAHGALAGGNEAEGGVHWPPATGEFGRALPTGAGGADAAVGAVELLGAARAALASAAAHDEALAVLERTAAELGYLATDLAADLAGYLAGIEVDPARAAWVAQRRADLAGLLRRHGPTTADALAWGGTAAMRLDELDGATERAAQLESELQEARDELACRGGELTDARTHAAKSLGERVTSELGQLAMGKAQLVVAVEPAGGLGPHGGDHVEIRLAANPGAPPRTVAKVASGGELSRVMLAIEVVTACDRTLDPTRARSVPTFVFDEVDAGVGGRAALAIGERLAALSRTSQVVVVTHLAQVAAFADRHLVVHKADDGHVTTSGVRRVEGEAQLTELARMMAGSDSDVAREHAAQLRADAAERLDRLPPRVARAAMPRGGTADAAATSPPNGPRGVAMAPIT